MNDGIEKTDGQSEVSSGISSVGDLAKILAGPAEEVVAGDHSENVAEEEETEEVEPIEAEEESTETDEVADEESNEEAEETEEVDPKELRTQEQINKRIAKEVKRRKEVEELKAAAEQQIEVLQRQLAEQSQIDPVQMARAAGINPLLVLDDRMLAGEEQRLKQIQKALKPLVYDPDGYTETDEQGNEVHYTPREVAQRLVEIDDQMEQIQMAKQLGAERMAHEEQAKTIFPELFDGKSELSAIYTNARRSIPGLATLPNAATLVSDMYVGQIVRQALNTKGAVLPEVRQLLKGLGIKSKMKAESVKPVIPSPAAKPKPRATQGQVRNQVYDASAVRKAGTVDALARQMANAM